MKWILTQRLLLSNRWTASDWLLMTIGNEKWQQSRREVHDTHSRKRRRLPWRHFHPISYSGWALAWNWNEDMVEMTGRHVRCRTISTGFPVTISECLSLTLRLLKLRCEVPKETLWNEDIRDELEWRVLVRRTSSTMMIHRGVSRNLLRGGQKRRSGGRKSLNGVQGRRPQKPETNANFQLRRGDMLRHWWYRHVTRLQATTATTALSTQLDHINYLYWSQQWTIKADLQLPYKLVAYLDETETETDLETTRSHLCRF